MITNALVPLVRRKRTQRFIWHHADKASDEQCRKESSCSMSTFQQASASLACVMQILNMINLRLRFHPAMFEHSPATPDHDQVVTSSKRQLDELTVCCASSSSMRLFLLPLGLPRCFLFAGSPSSSPALSSQVLPDTKPITWGTCRQQTRRICRNQCQPQSGGIT